MDLHQLELLRRILGAPASRLPADGLGLEAVGIQVATDKLAVADKPANTREFLLPG